MLLGRPSTGGGVGGGSRYLDEWNIQQHLVRVKALAKSMKGEEIARELIEVLSVHLSISSS